MEREVYIKTKETESSGFASESAVSTTRKR